MTDTATPEQQLEAQGAKDLQGALADASNVDMKPSTASAELASAFRASCVDQCAALFRTCAALPGPVVPFPTPNIRSLTDVTLKVIGPCIEGQSENLDTLVNHICSGIASDDDAIRVAVKNMVIQEANRKSYSHDKQSVKRESVLESTRDELLWRWEVKKVSFLGEYKPIALEMRSWLRKAQQCLATRLHAVKVLQKITGGHVTQKQQAALEKAQQAVMPGTPPVPCDQAAVVLPTELATPQEEVPEETAKATPTKAKLPAKERKSEETKDAVASRGFGSRSGLERSRGVMALFVQKVPQAKIPSPQKITDAEQKGDQDEDQSIKLQYIIDALKSPGDVDVHAHWTHVLQNKWKPIGRKMDQGHVPGLPPAFARKADAPRDSGQLAQMIFGHDNWKGVRTWRRKLLYFPSDSNRPPFHGSFSRRSDTVSSRRVLRKDADMDYEVLSDEEWEEEPDGEELDGSDGDDDAGMDEEEDTDGFMVADGYLSEDERDHDQGSDMNVWDPSKVKAGLGNDVEQVLHSIVDQPTTSYLNVMLSAKAQGQPVVICRSPGLTAAGEGFKVRSAELLQPLQMSLLETRVAVVPATTNFDKTPMETLTALADSAAAAGSLQKEVGPFVDSLPDEAARHKSFIIDAVMEKFKPSIPRSRIATVVLPASIAYCSSCKRWLSVSTMKALASAAKASVRPAVQLLPNVNSASLQQWFACGTLSVQLTAQACTTAAVVRSQPDAAAPSLGSDMPIGTEVKATLVAKKRRLQPTQIDEHDGQSKQVCLGTTSRPTHPDAFHATDTAGGDAHIADCAPSIPDACAVRVMCAVNSDADAMTATVTSTAQNARTDTQAPVPQPPQPGQGSMEDWMRDNPGRPRLPGGGDNVFVNGRDRAPLSPVASTCNRQHALSFVMTRQPSRRRKSQQLDQASAHVSKPDSRIMQASMDCDIALIENDVEKENARPGTMNNLLHKSGENGHVSPDLHRDCTGPVTQSSEMHRRAPGLSPPLSLHSRILPSLPVREIEGPIDPINDDHDPSLQAALLASIEAEDHLHTPAMPTCVISRQVAGNPDSITQSDTSLAARSLQTLALDPSPKRLECARLPPTPAGALASSTTAITAGAKVEKSESMPRDVPVDRVTARLVSDLASYQQQRLKRVATHLKTCMKSTPQRFSSWRALCTFLAMVPSVRDTDTLRVAKDSIEILEFLKPKWKSQDVFEVPQELLNVCLRACNIRRIGWLHNSAMKCVIAIAMGVIRRTSGCDGVQMADRPGCISLTSLACNECLLRAMVNAAAVLHTSNLFSDMMFGKQALMVLKEILQSSLGRPAAQHIAGIRCQSTDRTLLHKLVLLRQVDEPKVSGLIHSVQLGAFTRVHPQGTCDVPFPPRLLPAECTEWYMQQLLQDLSAPIIQEERRGEAVEVLEALLQAPKRETRGDLGRNFVNALASMSTRSVIMNNASSMARVQFKSLLRRIFVPPSTCICSKMALPMFRLCSCLLTTDSCQELQKLVIHAFRTPLKNPRERSGPSTHQVVQKAVAFYVESCANDPLEDGQKAAVVESVWIVLDQFLKCALAATALGPDQQSGRQPCPRPAALRFADTGEQMAARLQGQKRAGPHSFRRKSKGQRMMLGVSDPRGLDMQ